MIKYVIEELNAYLEFIFSKIPGRSGILFRYHFYKHRFKRIGNRAVISCGCVIREPGNISLGDDVGLGINNQLLAGNKSSAEHIKIGDHTKTNSNVIINADLGGKIYIGNNVLIGPNTVLRASNHVFEDKNIPILQQGHSPGQIIIYNDVWIASNVTIVPNVTIGEGAVIGAGAVVTKDIQPFTIAGGVPAKKISERI